MRIIRRLGRLNNRIGMQRLSPGVRSAIVLVQLMVFIALALAIAFFLVRALIGLATPTGAEAILKSASAHRNHVADIEIVRSAQVEGTRIEGHSLRVVATDHDHELFQMRLMRVFPGATDALLARTATGTFLRRDLNPIQSVEEIPFSSLTLPGPGDIAAAQPRVIRDDRSVRGVRAWEIGFTLTPSIIAGLMLTETLSVSGPDEEAIAQGRFATDWAYVLVTRRGRNMVVLDTRFQVEDGARYRILAKFRDFGSVDLTREEQAIAEPAADPAGVDAPVSGADPEVIAP